MKKYFIKTFGCQMNEADSEKIAGWYEGRGWKKAKIINEADEVVINTCSVRQSAEDRVFGLINNLEKLKIVPTLDTQCRCRGSSIRRIGKNCKLKIVVTGCMLYHPLKWLKEKLSQVDEFRKKEDFFDLSKLAIRDSKTHAWVSIMEGCNNFCTYCVVPFARGKEVSRPFEEIVCEVEGLTRRGYKEITLLGQNVNSYRPSFAKLLRWLHNIKGIKKISFITSNPWDLADDIIRAMSLPKIDRYLHLPVQSGDDEILRKMNRGYTTKQYLNLVKKIRRKIPKIKIGTDIIVGFPGETKKQFENTVKLCKKVGFVKAYIAIYSPRPGTAAYKLSDDVSYKEKKRRWQVLDDLINKKSLVA